MVKVRRSFACCTVWKVRERACLPRTTRKRKEGEKKEKLCLFDWVIQAIVAKSNCENTDYRGNGLLRWWPKSSWRCLSCGWLSTPTAGGATKQTAKIRLARSNMKSTVEQKSKAQSWRQTATVVTEPSGLQRVSFPLFSSLAILVAVMLFCVHRGAGIACTKENVLKVRKGRETSYFQAIASLATYLFLQWN